MKSDQPRGVPATLHGEPEAIVLFNNLPSLLTRGESLEIREETPGELERRTVLALEIDRTMREQAPAGWKEDFDGPRGKQMLNALFPLMNHDRRATLALFEIIKNQPGYWREARAELNELPLTAEVWKE